MAKIPMNNIKYFGEKYPIGIDAEYIDNVQNNNNIVSNVRIDSDTREIIITKGNQDISIGTSGGRYEPATREQDGLMSKEDKILLEDNVVIQDITGIEPIEDAVPVNANTFSGKQIKDFMLKNDYDFNKDGVVNRAAIADIAVNANAATSATFAQNAASADKAKNGWWLYYCDLLPDQWVSDETGSYSQTVFCEPIDGGPEFNENTITTGLSFDSTEHSVDVIKDLQKVLGILLKGKRFPSLNNITFTVYEKPTLEIQLYIEGRE